MTARQRMLLLSFLVGLLASLAAWLLHSLIALIQNLLTSKLHFDTFNWLYLVLPVVGIWITSLFVKYVVKDNISHGITRILYAISRRNSHLRPHNCWTSIVAAAITIGFGGSVGAEAPIVLTGSAIGSNLGQLFKIDKKMLLVLVGCGASAAIAGIFKAPIAGLVFTLEVLMVDLSMASLLPILTASVTATCFTYLLTGTDALFAFNNQATWDILHLPPTLLLGIFCAIVSLCFMRTMSFCEGIFSRLKDHRYARLLLGALLLSSLIFLFPSLYGEGYGAIDTLLNGQQPSDWNKLLNNSLFYGQPQLLLVYVALVILTKAIATSATNGAGGVGGTFAPSLFVGAFSGFFFARLWNINVHQSLSESNFTLLGMAAVMAAVMHAPLTGIFLIAETTGGYSLFIPLIVVSLSAVVAISIFEPHSIYATRLARQGKLLTHHTDHSVLTLMSIHELIETDYTAVETDTPLVNLVRVISHSHTSFIPVLDKGGQLIAHVDITRIRHIMFRTELYQRFTVEQLMTPVPAMLKTADPMTLVMERFEQTGEQYLPVVDSENHLEGYLSRTHVYNVYRKMVADFSAE